MYPKNRNGSVFVLIRIYALLLIQLIGVTAYAQEKHSIQMKTFDLQLAPYTNIEVSVNDKNYVSMGAKGIAFIELTSAELPVRTIKIKNERLEAASWNYSKGTLEIIVRTKSYQIANIIVKEENLPAPNLKVVFKGRKTTTVTTNKEGRIEIPIALDEKITSANQFSIDGYRMIRFAFSSPDYLLTIDKIVLATPADPPTEQVKPETPKDYFNDFDLSKLDSIQSLTVFYTIFKDLDRKDLSAEQRQRVDAKFNELVLKLESSAQTQGIKPFIGKINDSTVLAADVRTLIALAKQEGETLVDQRSEFDQKLKVISDKLSGGITNLDEATRKKLLNDLTLLEQILVQNESRFYKNQNDYRSLINSIKEKYFNMEDLEQKLTASETQRLEEQQLFRQRLIGISVIVLVFGLLIVMLIYFSAALRKQKKKLEAANEEIKRINENLESIVFARTRLLESANKELDTFLYRASHDMRTPVRSVLGLCNIASQIAEDEPKELIGRIVDTTMSMDRLLKKLSIISEINQPSNFSAIRLLEVFEQVHYSFRRTIEEHKINFTIVCPEDLAIYSYPNLVETIISNITENALYYSSLNGNQKAIVEIKAERTDDMVSVQIQDNGVGISDEIKEKVFDMFFKGTEFSKGNGLGLYIVQKALDALEGKARVESVPGRYTIFVLMFPIRPTIKLQDEKQLVAHT